MRVFVTGATGFIGSTVVRELIDSGHQVLGLARSDAAAARLAAAGAEIHRDELEDLDSLRSEAAASDGVIHVASASVSDVSDPAKIVQTALRAIDTFGAAFAGSNRPLVVTSGVAVLAPDRLGTEDDAPDTTSAMPVGIALEEAALALFSRGVRVSVVRLPFSVHGKGDHGFVPALIDIAHAKGVSAYPGNGSNRWPAVHRLDAAHLFRLAVEGAKAGSRLHGVAEQGVPVREIAGIIGRRLNIPAVSVPVAEAGEHFGFLGQFFSMEYTASSTLTQQRLGWHPVQPGLLEDLDQEYYFTSGELLQHRL